TEAPPLASAPISKKEKQSLKFPLQDKQAHLEKIIEKIIEKELSRAKSFSDSHMDSSDSIRSFLIEAIRSYKTSSKEFWQGPPAKIS
ncbi:15892_t:CDS:2, partial [Gigaspora margarita]